MINPRGPPDLNCMGEDHFLNKISVFSKFSHFPDFPIYSDVPRDSERSRAPEPIRNRHPNARFDHEGAKFILLLTADGTVQTSRI